MLEIILLKHYQIHYTILKKFKNCTVSLNAINRKLNFVVIIIAHITFLPTVTNNEISMVSVKLGENLFNLEHLWLDGNHLNSIPSILRI